MIFKNKSNLALCQQQTAEKKLVVFRSLVEYRMTNFSGHYSSQQNLQPNFILFRIQFKKSKRFLSNCLTSFSVFQSFSFILKPNPFLNVNNFSFHRKKQSLQSYIGLIPIKIKKKKLNPINFFKFKDYKYSFSTVYSLKQANAPMNKVSVSNVKRMNLSDSTRFLNIDYNTKFTFKKIKRQKPQSTKLLGLSYGNAPLSLETIEMNEKKNKKYLFLELLSWKFLYLSGQKVFSEEYATSSLHSSDSAKNVIETSAINNTKKMTSRKTVFDTSKLLCSNVTNALNPIYWILPFWGIVGTMTRNSLPIADLFFLKSSQVQIYTFKGAEKNWHSPRIFSKTHFVVAPYIENKISENSKSQQMMMKLILKDFNTMEKKWNYFYAIKEKLLLFNLQKSTFLNCVWHNWSFFSLIERNLIELAKKVQCNVPFSEASLDYYQSSFPKKLLWMIRVSPYCDLNSKETKKTKTQASSASNSFIIQTDWKLHNNIVFFSLNFSKQPTVYSQKILYNNNPIRSYIKSFWYFLPKRTKDLYYIKKAEKKQTAIKNLKKASTAEQFKYNYKPKDCVTIPSSSVNHDPKSLSCFVSLESYPINKSSSGLTIAGFEKKKLLFSQNFFSNIDRIILRLNSPILTGSPSILFHFEKKGPTNQLLHPSKLSTKIGLKYLGTVSSINNCKNTFFSLDNVTKLPMFFIKQPLQYQNIDNYKFIASLDNKDLNLKVAKNFVNVNLNGFVTDIGTKMKTFISVYKPNTKQDSFVKLVSSQFYSKLPLVQLDFIRNQKKVILIFKSQISSERNAKTKFTNISFKHIQTKKTNNLSKLGIRLVSERFLLEKRQSQYLTKNLSQKQTNFFYFLQKNIYFFSKPKQKTLEKRFSISNNYHKRIAMEQPIDFYDTAKILSPNLLLQNRRFFSFFKTEKKQNQQNKKYSQKNDKCTPQKMINSSFTCNTWKTPTVKLFQLETKTNDLQYSDQREIKKNKQKKRRFKKQQRQTRRRKKRKRFFPRPLWLRFNFYEKFLKKRHSFISLAKNNSIIETQEKLEKKPFKNQKLSYILYDFLMRQGIANRLPSTLTISTLFKKSCLIQYQSYQKDKWQSALTLAKYKNNINLRLFFPTVKASIKSNNCNNELNSSMQNISFQNFSFFKKRREKIQKNLYLDIQSSSTEKHIQDLKKLLNNKLISQYIEISKKFPSNCESWAFSKTNIFLSPNKRSSVSPNLVQTIRDYSYNNIQLKNIWAHEKKREQLKSNKTKKIYNQLQQKLWKILFVIDNRKEFNSISFWLYDLKSKKENLYSDRVTTAEYIPDVEQTKTCKQQHSNQKYQISKIESKEKSHYFSLNFTRAFKNKEAKISYLLHTKNPQRPFSLLESETLYQQQNPFSYWWEQTKFSIDYNLRLNRIPIFIKNPDFYECISSWHFSFNSKPAQQFSTFLELNHKFTLGFIFFAFSFHFCSLLSLITITQIRSILKFSFLVFYKVLSSFYPIFLYFFTFIYEIFVSFTQNVWAIQFNQITSKTFGFISKKEQNLLLSFKNQTIKKKPIYSKTLFRELQQFLVKNKDPILLSSDIQSFSPTQEKNMYLYFKSTELDKVQMSFIDLSDRKNPVWVLQCSPLPFNKVQLQPITSFFQNSAIFVIQTGKRKMQHYYHQFSFSFFYSIVGIINLLESWFRIFYLIFEKPTEFSVDWIAQLFLIEWSSDSWLSHMPDIIEYAIWGSYVKFSRSLRLIGPFGFLIQRRYWNFFENCCTVLNQPDTDLIVRQKKGILFWDIWAELLLKKAENYKMNILSLSTTKEEQQFLFEKWESEKETNLFTNKKFILENKNKFDLLKYNIIGHQIIIQYEDKIHFHFRHKHKIEKWKRWAANQFFIYASKLIPDLFIDVHLPKSLMTSQKPFLYWQKLANNSAKFAEIESENAPFYYKKKTPYKICGKKLNTDTNSISEVQTLDSFRRKVSHNTNEGFYETKWNCCTLAKTRQKIFQTAGVQVDSVKGSLICDIYSGIFLKQPAKNILVTGNKKTDKKQIIQAIAGETELKMITDNANRYTLVMNGLPIGIRLLKDVFDAIGLHTPCLFLLEDIHVIGERRASLMSEDDSITEIIFGSEKEEIHEKNQMLYALSHHKIAYYRKPFSSLLQRSNGFSKKTASFRFVKKTNILKDARNQQPLHPFLLQEDQKKTTEFGLNPNIYTNDGLKDTRSILEFKNTLHSFGGFSPVGNTTMSKTVSPYNILSNKSVKLDSMIKEKKVSSEGSSTFKIQNVVPEIPWFGFPMEQVESHGMSIGLLSRYAYSVKIKILVLVEKTLENIYIKVNMITDLLLIIDSVRSNHGFIVFGTTHLPSILDPALRRPGRFDETISLPAIKLSQLQPYSFAKRSELNIKQARNLVLESVVTPSRFFTHTFSKYFLKKKASIAWYRSHNANLTFVSFLYPCRTYLQLTTEKNQQQIFQANQVKKGIGIPTIKQLQTSFDVKKISFLLKKKRLPTALTDFEFIYNKNKLSKQTLQTDIIKYFSLLRAKSYIHIITQQEGLTPEANFFSNIIKSFSFQKRNNLYRKTLDFKKKKQCYKNSVLSEIAPLVLDQFDHIKYSGVQNLSQKSSSYLHTNNLIIKAELRNKISLQEPPSSPISRVSLPSRRFENYKRAEKDSIGIGFLAIEEKVKLHQSQKMIQRLYGVSNLIYDKNLHRQPPQNSKDVFLTYWYQGFAIRFYRNKILKRHRLLLTNQWWNGQFAEHNKETLFASDVDWRFIGLIGDISYSSMNQKPTTTKSGDAQFVLQTARQNNEKSNTSKTSSVKLLTDSKKNSIMFFRAFGTSQELPYSVMIDFPDSEQFYNPKERRWMITNGYWEYWFNFKTFPSVAIMPRVFYNDYCTDKNRFQKLLEQNKKKNSINFSYKKLNKKREIIDYMSYKLLEKGI